VPQHRLIFLNRFFFPDHSATSQLLSDLAFYVAKSGTEVHIVTTRQLYGCPLAHLPRNETMHGVHVHRVASTQFGRSALWRRLVDYVTCYISMWHCVFSLAAKGDILIAKTDPPLMGLAVMLVATLKGAHLINWLQDIYPEAAAELGVSCMTGPLGRLLRLMRDTSLRTALANIVVGERMAELIRSRGVSYGRVHVIHNWVNDNEIFPLCNTQNPLRRVWALEQKFVVGYSGNLGRAHEFETILSAAELLRNDPNILFLFIGGGDLLDSLVSSVQNRELDQKFRFLQYQSQEVLNQSLNVPDVHLISLKPKLEGLIVPSKFYGIAAAAKPIISITSNDGEIARLVREYGCGVVIEPGEGAILADKLLQLSLSPTCVAEMGKRARVMLEYNFSRKKALDLWSEVLGTPRSASKDFR
jgi:colanic acid biosynthesis glycosyl transferase WcaI